MSRPTPRVGGVPSRRVSSAMSCTGIYVVGSGSQPSWSASSITRRLDMPLPHESHHLLAVVIGKNEGDLSADQLRVAVYNRWLRSASGVKLAGWSSGPIAWTAVAALISLLMWVFKEDIFHPRFKKL